MIEGGGKLEPLKNGMSGALSGMFTRFTCQPFDVVKIRLQLQTTSKLESKYRSILQTAYQITSDEGILALWKGHVPAQGLSIVYGATQFSIFEALTKHSKNNLNYFAAGAVSGGVAVYSSYPFDVIRTRLIAQGEPKVYHGTWDAAKKIFVSEGLLGFFKGINPALLSTIPISALVFGFNHIILTTMQRFTNDIGLGLSLVSGATAGLCAKGVVYPLDLIKKRIQASGMPKGSSAIPILRHSSLKTVIVTTIRNEGFSGLYKGFSPSLVKAAVSNAVYLTSYDRFHSFIFQK